MIYFYVYEIPLLYPFTDDYCKQLHCFLQLNCDPLPKSFKDIKNMDKTI